ncbi:Asp23/Gls24 family envelope stress response protein [Actinomycetospora atypica]|uniref:Asp23/Gls24 family envelope stress response protein n=1 Tax=Actinomycetospora atypica TaxID=1290095 RepID=A0ABV9YG37_9PSEU
MSTSTVPTTATPATGAGTRSPLETTQGRTTIADGVVAKIAGLAAREVNGVHGFGGGAARAFGAIAERIPGARSSSTQGVSVEVGERQAAVDVTVVVEYGVAIPELARAIRRNVIGAVEQMTGLEVVEVNVDVTDLHLPSDDDDSDDAAPASTPARVR